MKGMCTHFDTIGCVREITEPIYFVGIVLPLPIKYHKTPPVTTGIVCSLNK